MLGCMKSDRSVTKDEVSHGRDFVSFGDEMKWTMSDEAIDFCGFDIE